jgi:DNA excision repair protein ERCC-2
MDKTHKNNPIRIAVRSLSEAVYRSGGLSGPSYAGVSSAEGIRVHQRCLKKISESYPDDCVQSEIPLQDTVTHEGLTWEVGGRCDALVTTPDQIIIYEFKSFRGSASLLPEDGESVHWAQAKLYAWLYCAQHETVDQMAIVLYYSSVDHSDDVQHVLTFCRHDLHDFFIESIQRYIQFAAELIRNDKIRHTSALNLHFPYAYLRPGQEKMMRYVVDAAKHKSPVYIQAPTGTGKTMATLYPAVKVQARRMVDRVFYLTHMTSTRQVAAKALSDLQQSGLLMKGLVLYAKEKLCLEPDLYCDTEQCPYARAYYDHLPDALRSLFLVELIDREHIIQCAKKFRVCPFELALDMALYCDIIICDYNYAFDPRVRLIRFFEDDQQTHLLLVDEAHNLPDRSRAMYSATLDLQTLHQAQSAIKGRDLELDHALNALLDWLERVYLLIKEGQAGLDQVEPSIRPEAVMRSGSFCATRLKPVDLLSRCNRFNRRCHTFLDAHPAASYRLVLLKAFFDILFFSRVGDEFYDETYITSVRTQDTGMAVTFMCLDASDKLSKSFLKRHATVFYSATLSPLFYFQGLIQGSGTVEQSDAVQMSSPFPPENFLVMVCSTLSTRYKDRQATIQPILTMILDAVRQKKGHYLVFVPSHAYLNMMRLLLNHMDLASEVDLMFQETQMNEIKRQRFLRRFDDSGDRTLLAFAVMGGIFAEGIDLAGEKLDGVVIIGVGLPKICPEREIMKQYYAQRLGNGYAYAYLYPGFNKVQQAAGRVIRSEHDRGFVLLIDDRYETSVYRSLFPSEWQVVSVSSSSEAAGAISEFWASG